MALGAQQQQQDVLERIADAAEHVTFRDTEGWDPIADHRTDCPGCIPIRAAQAVKKAGEDKVKADADAARIAKEDADRLAREKANEPAPVVAGHTPALFQSRQAVA